MGDSLHIVIPRASATEARAIYSPAAADLLTGAGKLCTQRASHVEPGRELSAAAVAVLQLAPETLREKYGDHWFADMSPCGHPVVLGPFAPNARDAALRAEVQFLLQHNLPTGKTRDNDSRQPDDD